jgi:WD40 repeat protein
VRRLLGEPETAAPAEAATALAAVPTAEPAAETATPAESPTATPSATAEEPTATAAASVTPTAGPAEGLVYAQAASLYLGDVLGRDAAEVVEGASLESWAFRDGMLATVTGRQIDIIDLPRGAIHSYSVDVPGELMHSRVLWSESADTLLYAAIVRDDMAADYGRSAVLRALAVEPGTVLGQATVPDVTDVLLLRYDPGSGQALIAPQGADPTLPLVQYWDLAAGAKVSERAVASDGLASVSPDGRYLLTTALDGDAGVRTCYLYDLTDAGAAPRTLALPADSHSASQVWSPDSQKVAYLLRDSLVSYEATTGLGVWVLDVATMTASEILPEPELGSQLISWTPDSALLVGYHRGLDDGTYF